MTEIDKLTEAIVAQNEITKAQVVAEVEKAKAEQSRIEEVRLLRVAEERRVEILERVLVVVQENTRILREVLVPGTLKEESILRFLLETHRFILPKLLEGMRSNDEINRLTELLKIASTHDFSTTTNITSGADTNVAGDVKG